MISPPPSGTGVGKLKETGVQDRPPFELRYIVADVMLHQNFAQMTLPDVSENSLSHS